MAKETLGYMKLEWTCPRCNSRNPGPQKTCLSCGAPQPEDVAFHLPERQELLQDENEINQAKKGADIHCPYCGARNPADAASCAQCGGSLEEGTRRHSGNVVGAFAAQPASQGVLCANCGAANEVQALKCVSCGAPLPRRLERTAEAMPKRNAKIGWLIGAALLILLSVCVAIIVLAFRTEGIEARVKESYWQSTLIVESLQPVKHSDWREEIPPEADILRCEPKVHHVQEEAVANANKVCGTPYTVDTGGGYAEVVQDCVYEVLMDYCEYEVMEWRAVEKLTQRGQDLPVVYALFNPAADQRIGERTASYVCIFDSSKGEFLYTTTDENLYRQCTPQSQWLLHVNSFGQIVSIERK